MDSEFALAHGFPLLPTSTTFTVSLADGSSAGLITTQTAPLILRLGSHVEKVNFLVTCLAVNTPIILGLPWMVLHNPSVNWCELTLSLT